MEDALYAEYKEARAIGTFLKRWWFNIRAKQLLKDHYPGKELKCSHQWFMRFYRRYGVALRRKTHAAQTDPKQLAPAITKFQSKLLRVRRCGVYQTKDIANMDQTPLPMEKHMQIKGAVKYDAYQDLLVLISGSAVCN